MWHLICCKITNLLSAPLKVWVSNCQCSRWILIPVFCIKKSYRASALNNYIQSFLYNYHHHHHHHYQYHYHSPQPSKIIARRRTPRGRFREWFSLMANIHVRVKRPLTRASLTTNKRWKWKKKKTEGKLFFSVCLQCNYCSDNVVIQSQA